MTARYFADIGLDRPVGDPYFLWRIVTEPRRDFERFDRNIRRWVSDPSLARYVYNGEIGSVEINEEKARGIVGGR
jgi:hypothetical protein